MVTISDLMICCFFSEIGEEVSPGRSQVTLSSVKPGTHTTFFSPPLQSRVEKKNPKKTNKQKTDISTAIIPLSGQCSQSLAESTDHELIARFFFLVMPHQNTRVSTRSSLAASTDQMLVFQHARLTEAGHSASLCQTG